MPETVVIDVSIYYETIGNGFPMVWCHELAGSCRSWDDQARYFSRRFRVITYNASGYPPSEIPGDVDAYTQEALVQDLSADCCSIFRLLLQHLQIQEVIVGGLSMGGTIALNFGIAHPEMSRALIIAGTGTGSTDPGPYRGRFVRR